MSVIYLDECASTNSEVADKERYHHGDAVVALSQTAGRGQRGRSWESIPGENLTFSVVLEPIFLRVVEQFLLSEAVALSLVDTLAVYGIDASIKWTNDIYVGDRKICGILIEHDLRNDYLSRSIIGIGLNVNQGEFSDWIPNPVSMSLVTGMRYDIREVFDTFYGKLMARFDSLREGGESSIQADYHDVLYRKDEPHKFIIPNEGEVVGVIREVRPSGELMVEVDGKLRGFLFKEIEFVI